MDTILKRMRFESPFTGQVVLTALWLFFTVSWSFRGRINYRFDTCSVNTFFAIVHNFWSCTRFIFSLSIDNICLLNSMMECYC